MACGTPVIAFNHGSVPEIVEDGVTGFIVEDEHAAVSVVGRLAGLSRSQVRKSFEERFTAARMAQDYLGIYERLVARRVDSSVQHSLLPARRAGMIPRTLPRHREPAQASSADPGPIWPCRLTDGADSERSRHHEPRPDNRSSRGAALGCSATHARPTCQRRTHAQCERRDGRHLDRRRSAPAAGDRNRRTRELAERGLRARTRGRELRSNARPPCIRGDDSTCHLYRRDCAAQGCGYPNAQQAYSAGGSDAMRCARGHNHACASRQGACKGIGPC